MGWKTPCLRVGGKRGWMVEDEGREVPHRVRDDKFFTLSPTNCKIIRVHLFTKFCFTKFTSLLSVNLLMLFELLLRNNYNLGFFLPNIVRKRLNQNVRDLTN